MLLAFFLFISTSSFYINLLLLWELQIIPPFYHRSLTLFNTLLSHRCLNSFVVHAYSFLPYSSRPFCPAWKVLSDPLWHMSYLISHLIWLLWLVSTVMLKQYANDQDVGGSTHHVNCAKVCVLGLCALAWFLDFTEVLILLNPQYWTLRGYWNPNQIEVKCFGTEEKDNSLCFSSRVLFPFGKAGDDCLINLDNDIYIHVYICTYVSETATYSPKHILLPYPGWGGDKLKEDSGDWWNCVKIGV